MEFPEENLKTEQPGKRTNIAMTLLLFAAVLAVAFFVYLKSQNIDISDVNIKEFIAGITSMKEKETDKEKVVEISYDAKERPAFSVYKDTVIKCTRDGISGLNKKGEELWTKSFTIENPIMKTNGTDVLIADIGGNEVCVINGSDVKWNIKVDNDIINADISESGHVTVVHEAKGYRSKIRVFDPLGVEMFERNIAEKFVLSARVSPSGKQLLINSIDAGGVSATSSLEFTDMLGNPFAARIPKDTLVFPSAWYLNDDSVFAVSDSYIVYFDKGRNEKWGKEFREVYSSNTVSGKYLVLAAASEKKGGAFGRSLTDIQVLNIKGQQISSYTIEDRVVNIDTYSDVIAINTGREVYFINTRGKLVGKYSSKSDIMRVYFFSKVEAAIVTKNSVVIIKIS